MKQRLIDRDLKTNLTFYAHPACNKTLIRRKFYDKSKNLGSFSLLLFAVTMASLVVRNGSLIVANLGVSTGTAAAILVVLKNKESQGCCFLK